MCRRAVSVCPSRSCILSKWVNVSSNFFHSMVFTPWRFFCTKRYGNISMETPYNWGKNRDFRSISGLAIYDCESVGRRVRLSHSAAAFVYHADGQRSASVSKSCLWQQTWTSFLSVDGYRPKRTEQNLILRIGECKWRAGTVSVPARCWNNIHQTAKTLRKLQNTRKNVKLDNNFSVGQRDWMHNCH